MAASKEKLSVLIIGCGAIAGGYDEQDMTGQNTLGQNILGKNILGPNILSHAKAYKTHGGFDLVGCLDLDRAIAQDFAKFWGVNKAYNSLDQAMKDRNFDIVSLCTSTPSHESYLRRLADQGIRLIFCEKPITDNLASAREMAALHKDNMAVNYIRRFDPDIIQLAQAINDKKYGKFLSGTARYNKGLYNNGSHMTDLLHWLLGPMSVRSAGDIIEDFWPDDPTLSARLEPDQGGQIELIGSDVQLGMIFDLDLVFAQARITLSDFSRRLTIQSGDGPDEQITTGLNRGMLNAVANIYDHLAQGATLQSTAANGLSALEICARIRAMAGLS